MENLELLKRTITYISVNYGLFATKPIYLSKMFEYIKEDTSADDKMILLFLRKLLNGMENQNYLSFEVAYEILHKIYGETKPYHKHIKFLWSFYHNQKYYLENQYKEIGFEYFK